MSLFAGSEPPADADAYAKRTYDSPHWIVRAPHRQRFSFVAEVVARLGARSVLDYGAGDGHLLARLLAAPAGQHIAAVALEPEGWFRDRIHEQLDAHGVGGRVAVVASLDELDPDARPDLITCTGVLEHLSARERSRFYAFADERLAPGGHLLIDVPVEHGASLLVKNLGRRLLKRDPPEYTARETLRAALGRTTFDPVRFDPDRGNEYIHSHKGFDHRLLRTELETRFRVLEAVPTPFRRLPPALGNQELFLVATRA